MILLLGGHFIFQGYFGGRMSVNYTLIIPDIIHPPAAPHSITSASRGTLMSGIAS